MADPHVVPFLDLSTAHLSLTTERMLAVDASSNSGAIAANPRHGSMPLGTAPVFWFDFGMILYLGDGAVFQREDLRAIRKVAQARGCSYVKFDCDAPELPGLPVYVDAEGVRSDTISTVPVA